jgi:hypothetical protein
MICPRIRRGYKLILTHILASSCCETALILDCWQVLAYLSKLSPEAAAALLSKANQEKNSSQLRNEDSEAWNAEDQLIDNSRGPSGLVQERPEDGENVAAFVMRTLAAGPIVPTRKHCVLKLADFLSDSIVLNLLLRQHCWS